jgi:hypothetical protein
MFHNVDGALILPIERAEATREFYIDTPQGRSPRYPFKVLQVPCFEKAEVAYQFPKYTGWPTARHALDARGIRALEKTEIVVFATGNLPLRSGMLELFKQDDELSVSHSSPTKTITLKPDPSDAKAVTGGFTLEWSGRYRLTLVGDNDVPSDEEREGTLVSVPDQMPQVAILEPDAQVIAVEGWKVPVTIQAIDDVGIDRVLMFTGVNGWGPDSSRLAIEVAQPTIARAHYDFDLARLGARAGDILTYYASAYDNHPSGTHYSDSPRGVIHVISKDEFAEMARQKYHMEQLAQEFESLQKRLEDLQTNRQKLLDELARLRKKLEAGEKLNAEELKKLAKGESLLKEFAEQAQTLAKELHDRAKQTALYEVEKPYRETLERLAGQLEKQAANAENVRKQMAELQKQPGNSQLAKALAASANKLEKENEPFDQATKKQLAETQQDMEKMRQADNLIAQGERLRAAILQQRDLADRIAQFRERKKLTDDELDRLQRMAKEQELLKQEVDEAKSELRKAADAAKKSLPNMSSGALELCRKIDEMKVGGDQGQAARSARVGEGSGASQAAESAAKKLESLLSKCCNPQNAMQSGDLDGCFKLSKPGLQESLRQMAQGRGIPGLGKQGNQGSGFAGSRTRMTIFGPHQLSQGESDASRSSGTANRGRGDRTSGRTRDNSRGAEALDAGARQTPRSAIGNLHGVPAGYRDQAEAYFKRLAKEE